MRQLLFLALFLSTGLLQAQVPAVGSSKRIDVGTWNLYWWGHDQNGPQNKSLQRQEVLNVLQASRIDIWALQEVCDTAALAAGLKDLGHFGYRFSDYWQDQKMALVWDNRYWESIADSQLLATFSADFASGRLPLMTLLVRKGRPDTLCVIGIHLKANTGNATEQEKSWENRRKSCLHLLEWTKQQENRNLIILGDWNDDLDYSLISGKPSSIDTLEVNGRFLTRELSEIGQNSWVFGSAMIDHIWLNTQLTARYTDKSCKRYLLDLYITDYAQTVSDHYPVYAALEEVSANPVRFVREPESLQLYPNPSGGLFYLRGVNKVEVLELYAADGRRVPFRWVREGDVLRLQTEARGLLTVRLNEYVFRLLVRD